MADIPHHTRRATPPRRRPRPGRHARTRSAIGVSAPSQRGAFDAFAVEARTFPWAISPVDNQPMPMARARGDDRSWH